MYRYLIVKRENDGNYKVIGHFDYYNDAEEVLKTFLAAGLETSQVKIFKMEQ